MRATRFPGIRLRALLVPLDLLLAEALVLLAGGVAVGGWPVRLDQAVYRALPSPSGPGLAGAVGDLAEFVAMVATPRATVALTLAVAAVISARSRSTRALRRVVPPVLAVTVTVLGGKALLHRAGPPGSPSYGHLGYFPSGHTTTALVCAATLAALLSDRHPAWQPRLRVAASTWPVIVAASMVFHRYHWLTDVLAAGLLGALILRLGSRSRTATPEPCPVPLEPQPAGARPPGADGGRLCCVCAVEVLAGQVRSGATGWQLGTVRTRAP